MYNESLKFSILLFASVFIISTFYAVFEPLQVQSQPVNSSNKVETAPIADAGHDQTATSGTIVTLNGSGSFDPDGDNITDYTWMHWTGPFIVLPEASPQSPSFGAPSVESPQNITFRLTVSDSKTESAADYTTVQIFPRGQAPPTTTASVPSPSPSPSTNASETVIDTNATTGVPQGEGVDTPTTSSGDLSTGDTIKRSISSLLSSSNISESPVVNSILDKISSSNISESPVVNSILDKIISTNGTSVSSLASLVGSLFSSPGDDNRTDIQDMADVAADVEASNATTNATDADAAAAEAAADDTTANETQTSSSSIQLDNTTTSRGNISVLSQSNDHKVSIVPGSSFLADKAYSPNPVEVKAGQKVTWTNDDLVQHTVTSGSPGAMDFGKSFDSGLVRLLNKAMTFEYTFATSGEYPYYCQLHPTMIGTVSVK